MQLFHNALTHPTVSVFILSELPRECLAFFPN